MPPKPQTIPTRLLESVGDRCMRYSAAFRCQRGVVMCADTLVTRGDHKNYVEKLEIVEDCTYPLAIDRAGVEDVLNKNGIEI